MERVDNMYKTTLARVGAIIALGAMAIGHSGTHNLIWTRDPISTFAARAPMDVFVTISMVLSAFTLVVVCLAAVEASSTPVFLRLIAPVISGVAAGGLLLLATFEETISLRLSTSPPTLQQVRIQAFHDAGLLLFFSGSLLLLSTLGILWIASRSGRSRYMGLVPIASAIGAFSVRIWPIFAAGWTGLSQRVSLLLIWIGLAAVAFVYLRRVPVPRTD
jgi:hypothetical protein